MRQVFTSPACSDFPRENVRVWRGLASRGRARLCLSCGTYRPCSRCHLTLDAAVGKSEPLRSFPLVSDLLYLPGGWRIPWSSKAQQEEWLRVVCSVPKFPATWHALHFGGTLRVIFDFFCLISWLSSFRGSRNPYVGYCLPSMSPSFFLVAVISVLASQTLGRSVST